MKIAADQFPVLLNKSIPAAGPAPVPAAGAGGASAGGLPPAAPIGAAVQQPKLDIIAFDAPLMASIEVANQVDKGADIMVASEGTKPIKGKESPSPLKNGTINWNYQDVLDRLNKNPSQNPTDYSKQIVQSGSTTGLDTISAINLAGIKELTENVDNFANPGDLRGDKIPEFAPAKCPPFISPQRTGYFDYQAINNYQDNMQTGALDSRIATQTFGGILGMPVTKYSYDLDGTPEGTELAKKRANPADDPVWGDMDFIDLYHFSELVQKEGRIKPAYKDFAAPIMTLLKKGGKVIIDEAHSGNFPNAHGLSIYFPFQQDRAKADPIHEFSYDSPQNLSDKIYQSAGLQFTQKAPWWKDDTDVKYGRMLRRYYTPVADAVVINDKKASKLRKIIVPTCTEVKVTVGFSGKGTSDSDFEGFATFGTQKLDSEYFWNFGDGGTCLETWNDKPASGNNNGNPEPSETFSCDGKFDGLVSHTYTQCGCFVVTLDSKDDDQKKDNDWAYVWIFTNDTPWIPFDPPGIPIDDGNYSRPNETNDSTNSTTPIPPAQPQNVSCAARTGGTVSKLNSSVMCIDDCSRLGRGYTCDGVSCTCKPPQTVGYCGDGVLIAPEECDPGSPNTIKCSNGGTCSEFCICSVPSQPRIPPPTTPTQSCGNGIREGTEQCDGSNSGCSSGQTCSQSCTCATPSTPPSTLPPSTPVYHAECQSQRCVQIQGSGSDQCGADSDCRPPVVNCPAYCSSQGYSQSLGGGYSTEQACRAAAAGSPAQCTTSCYYSKFYTSSNQAGTTTCCCSSSKTFSCSNCPGENPQCPDPNVVCPANQPGG
ncbi:MAG: hypothetical protein HZC29_02365 [Thaumarchaeota archaeon]|nr:hypothetical protein [Nitrososphaerota archaeon]